MTEKVMNLPSPSIYEVIEHNLDPNLKLPREFSLRAHRRSPGEKLVYADGFMEGNLTGSGRRDQPGTAGDFGKAAGQAVWRSPESPECLL